jgi:acetylornithine deacetylase
MEAIRAYHHNLVRESRGNPFFREFENPMPLNFGTLYSGTWPSKVPDRARLEGLMGILSNHTKDQVMTGLKKTLVGINDPWLKNHAVIEFTYKHDAHEIEAGHPWAAHFCRACTIVNSRSRQTMMPASCDSYFYHRVMGAPTIVFGAGNLKHAHSTREQINLLDIVKAASILVISSCDAGGQ